ncbi:hypothetical protein DPEC_G00038310 [Dallia pectoralis]|uniref:Uncharacterized protein n=1 Tax=Dallia pectoralis TaxID=75939 RepID=A0ACC2HET9_DALPE|nr:hypothetical protein DPEC_G00038310 [Dallia pectoralis]
MIEEILSEQEKGCVVTLPGLESTVREQPCPICATSIFVPKATSLTGSSLENGLGTDPRSLCFTLFAYYTIERRGSPLKVGAENSTAEPSQQGDLPYCLAAPEHLERQRGERRGPSVSDRALGWNLRLICLLNSSIVRPLLSMHRRSCPASGSIAPDWVHSSPCPPALLALTVPERRIPLRFLGCRHGPTIRAISQFKVRRVRLSATAPDHFFRGHSGWGLQIAVRGVG